MTQPYYPFNSLATEGIFRFDFESVSQQKIIQKRIEYVPTATPNIFNLSLVDLMFDGSADDMVISDNADMEKIIATVFQTLLLFFRQKPTSWVYFEGSTPSRTRLYRIIISKELEKAQELFYIYGIEAGRAVIFAPNVSYSAFLFRFRKAEL